MGEPQSPSREESREGEKSGVASFSLHRRLRNRVEGYERCTSVFLVIMVFSCFSWYEFIEMRRSGGGDESSALFGDPPFTDLSHSELPMSSPNGPPSSGYDMYLRRKIAFLFLALHDLPLIPLWAKFFQGHKDWYSIYINLKPGYSLTHLPETFKEAKQFNYNTSWGGFGLIEAEVMLLSSALRDRENDRFILLSESCIPVYDFEFFYHYVMNSSLSYVDIITEEGHRSSNRYTDCLAPVVPREAWTKGTQWKEVNYEVALLITNDKLYFSKFKECCATNVYIIPDEHYIQTLLRNTAAHLLANRSLTWNFWPAGNYAHPQSYDQIDQALIDLIRSEKCTWNGIPNSPCHLIARKFTPKALPSLLEFSNALGY